VQVAVIVGKWQCIVQVAAYSAGGQGKAADLPPVVSPLTGASPPAPIEVYAYGRLVQHRPVMTHGSLRILTCVVAARGTIQGRNLEAHNQGHKPQANGTS